MAVRRVQDAGVPGVFLMWCGLLRTTFCRTESQVRNSAYCLAVCTITVNPEENRPSERRDMRQSLRTDNGPPLRIAAFLEKGVGGAEKIFLEYTDALSRTGCTVYTIVGGELDADTLAKWQAWVPQREYLTVPFHRRNEYLIPVIVPSLDWRCNSKLAGLLSGLKPDLIIVNQPGPDDAQGALRVATACRPEVPVIAFVHIAAAKALRMKLRSVKLWWASRVYKHVSRIVTVSHACKRSLVEDYHVDENKVSIVPNGVRDVERLSEDDVLAVRASLGLARDDVAALWAGRFTIEKGVDILLRALENSSEWHPRVRVFLAGDGPLRRELETEYKHLVDSQTVKFLGWQKDVGRLVQAVDFVVMPSRLESFGLFLVEAMAAGRACVASNVLGIPEVVADGETGILVPSENPIVLADGMKRLASDPALRASMGRAARMRYERLFTFSRCAKLFEDEILGLLQVP